MRFLAALALVGLVLLGAGCLGGSHEAKPYSAVDIGWIKRVNSWNEQYARREANTGPYFAAALESHAGLAPLRKVLRPYRQCTRGLRAMVGEPEAERLRRAYGFLLEACDKEERFARALLKSAKPNPGYPSADQYLESDWPFHEAFQQIEDGLIANRKLPERGGQTDESRIEPRLSEAARALTQRDDIEVRCWSEKDWPRMNTEYNAYAGDREDPSGFVTGATREHIFPSYCEVLARFLYDDWRPADNEGVQELAKAVGLVAHETEHLFETGLGEAETECHAAQDVRQLAGLLGASSSYASQLAAVYWRDVYPAESAEYRSKDCRSGGAFDRHPETAAFPSG